MLKRLVVSLLFAAFCAHANAADVGTAPIANVKFIHNYIKQKWNVDVPYNSALDNTAMAANMRYLLTSVDVANQIMNGFKPLDHTTGEYATYGNGEYATSAAANTTTAVRAIDTLIRKIEFPLWVVPETDDSNFIINIAAAGTFFINWGDGVIEKWTKDVGPADISHNYSDAANNHTVHIGGTPTRYPLTDNGAIYFGNSTDRSVREVGGCIGCVFGTIEDGTEEWHQPKFHQTFRMNAQLTSVPSGFFDGLYGGAGRRMFWNAFSKSGIVEFPDNLFGTSRLEPAKEMFVSFCDECTSLQHIPDNMFANISGDATDVESLFYNSFNGCSALKEIPVDLFGNLENINKSSVFYHMFYNARAVVGPLAPKLNGKYVWEWWPDWTPQMLYFVPLDNWEVIPAGWR